MNGCAAEMAIPVRDHYLAVWGMLIARKSFLYEVEDPHSPLITGYLQEVHFARKPHFLHLGIGQFQDLIRYIIIHFHDFDNPLHFLHHGQSFGVILLVGGNEAGGVFCGYLVGGVVYFVVLGEVGGADAGGICSLIS